MSNLNVNSRSESVPGNEKPCHILQISEGVLREKLVKISEQADTHPLIAVDLDDVLCQTNACVAEWHNRRFGTNMQIKDFYYSTWYKNPGWGSIATTMNKVNEFYDTDQLKHADPVPGSLDALNHLREIGYSLIIVTARTFSYELNSTIAWLDKHFNGIFSNVVFSSQDGNSLAYNGRCIGTSLNKLQISEVMQSILLIDDLLETALTFGRNADRPVLLFGDYEWNKRVVTGGPWTFDDKLALEGGNEWWKDDTIGLHSEDRIWKVRNWEEVLEWLKEHGAELI